MGGRFWNSAGAGGSDLWVLGGSRGFRGIEGFPETSKPLNEGIYLKSYKGSYYNLRYIP